MHHLLAELVLQPAHADGEIVAPIIEHRHNFRLFGREQGEFLGHGQFHPSEEKNTAKNASRTMTRKMPCTTAAVVLRPTSSAFALTCIP